eukprot:scaffold39102_cov29-Prasinocladus_malaysianus.AAC.1
MGVFFSGLCCYSVVCYNIWSDFASVLRRNHWLGACCRIADSCVGVDRLPRWREAMYKANSANKRANPTTYRDEQYDPELQEEAAR